MSTLAFAALRQINVTRCLKWQPKGLADWNYPDWLVAVGGELGEALNLVKKLNRERDRLVGNTLSPIELRAELADELTDTVIYLDLLMASEDQIFFFPNEGMDTFADLRAANERARLNMAKLNGSLSSYGAQALRAIGKLADADVQSEVRHHARLLLGMLEFLAHEAGIDLGDAVVSKFDRTSEKRGFPERLAGAA